MSMNIENGIDQIHEHCCQNETDLNMHLVVKILIKLLLQVD